jgi:hypothetical protein
MSLNLYFYEIFQLNYYIWGNKLQEILPKEIIPLQYKGNKEFLNFNISPKILQSDFTTQFRDILFETL